MCYNNAMMRKISRYLLLAIMAVSLQGTIAFEAYAGCVRQAIQASYDTPCHGQMEMEQQTVEKPCCQEMICLKCIHFSVMAAGQAAIVAPFYHALHLSFRNDGLKDFLSLPFERPPKALL